jgi:hypothetical protein
MGHGVPSTAGIAQCVAAALSWQLCAASAGDRCAAQQFPDTSTQSDATWKTSQVATQSRRRRRMVAIVLVDSLAERRLESNLRFEISAATVRRRGVTCQSVPPSVAHFGEEAEFWFWTTHTRRDKNCSQGQRSAKLMQNNSIASNSRDLRRLSTHLQVEVLCLEFNPLRSRGEDVWIP